METINEVTYCPFCRLWQVDVDKSQVLWWRVPALIDEAVAEHLEEEWDTHRRWALLALSGETCAKVAGCVDGRHGWGCPFSDPMADVLAAMTSAVKTSRDEGGRPQCRHTGGTSDCPVSCMVIYGDSFLTAVETGPKAREED